MAVKKLKVKKVVLSKPVTVRPKLRFADKSPGYHPEGYSMDSDVLVKQAENLIDKGAEQIAKVEEYLNRG